MRRGACEFNETTTVADPDMCFCPLDLDEESRSIDVVVPYLGEAVSVAILVAWYVELNQHVPKGALNRPGYSGDSVA